MVSRILCAALLKGYKGGYLREEQKTDPKHHREIHAFAVYHDQSIALGKGQADLSLFAMLEGDEHPHASDSYLCDGTDNHGDWDCYARAFYVADAQDVVGNLRYLD